MAFQCFSQRLLNPYRGITCTVRHQDGFFRWQAPWLLLLQALNTDTRREYEQYARIQPIKVAQQFHLYPEIIDRETIDTARIEVRLREALPGKPREEVSYSTADIELCPESVD